MHLAYDIRHWNTRTYWSEREAGNAIYYVPVQTQVHMMGTKVVSMMLPRCSGTHEKYLGTWLGPRTA